MHKSTIAQSVTVQKQTKPAKLGRINVNVPEDISTAVRVYAINVRKPLWQVVTEAIAKYCGISPDAPRPRAARKPAKRSNQESTGV